MPVFGGYETVRELFRSGLASAYTARKVGGDPHTVVYSLDQSTAATPRRALRIEVSAGGCLRELGPLDLALD